MAPLKVYQIVVTVGGYKHRQNITVSLYKGGVKVGACDTHPGNVPTKTLICDKVVADMVKLTMTDAERRWLVIAEITVSGVLNATSGQ